MEKKTLDWPSNKTNITAICANIAPIETIPAAQFKFTYCNASASGSGITDLENCIDYSVRDRIGYLDISTGKLNPQLAFMTGRITAKGDLVLAMKMPTIFKA